MWGIYEERLNGGGFEMYEKQPGEEILVPTTIVRPSDNKTVRVLRLGEINERIRCTFYRLEEQDPESSSQFVDAINNLITTIISLPTTTGNLPTLSTPLFPLVSTPSPVLFTVLGQSHSAPPIPDISSIGIPVASCTLSSLSAPSG